jgi:hypothetical protein
MHHKNMDIEDHMRYAKILHRILHFDTLGRIHLPIPRYKYHCLAVEMVMVAMVLLTRTFLSSTLHIANQDAFVVSSTYQTQIRGNATIGTCNRRITLRIALAGKFICQSTTSGKQISQGFPHLKDGTSKGTSVALGIHR